MSNYVVSGFAFSSLCLVSVSVLSCLVDVSSCGCLVLCDCLVLCLSLSCLVVVLSLSCLVLACRILPRLVSSYLVLFCVSPCPNWKDLGSFMFHQVATFLPGLIENRI